jgi:hypothetical protein
MGNDGVDYSSGCRLVQSRVKVCSEQGSEFITVAGIGWHS